MSDNIWSYGPSSGRQEGTDLTGYKVEATDGHIGKVDKHSEDVGSSYLVVDTGMWIFGKHVLLPAGTIASVDHQEEKVYVARTKDQIKDAPEFDKDKHTADPVYHDQIGVYYTQHPHM
ncbi:PRC-barrel domain-containing protein [Streptomyces sp. H27-C3]|uniref:PRC-barrel domain-containing protein n=1 Tax=Streptomyces sp. H27-C3 TaxID=3046305 RepID=UPI0024B9F01B|nr:PRC-barrel domain-containing protein [Streptomyces sp. H27-C3]MDJ0467068.1 PRC-barrel domain-containing protein [Streptomyces sp. H27-C3]